MHPYSYDDNSNIVSKQFNHRTTYTPSNVYTYDTLNRVTGSDYLLGHLDDNWDEEFIYDILGNRDSHKVDGFVTDTYTSNTVNEYTQIVVNSVTKTPVHDNAGNLTTDIKGYIYIYDYENRLIKIEKPDTPNPNIIVAEYTYDALGRRIQAENALPGGYPGGNGKKYTRFYYDGNRVLLETNLDDDLDATSEFDVRSYVFGNYIDEVLIMTDHDSVHTCVESADLYYAHDHLYSPVALFADNGGVLERYEYDAYGKCTVLYSNYYLYGDRSGFNNPYLYTGRRLDILDSDANGKSSLKIQYSRARYYDPETGRFLKRDPAQYVNGMSLYQYVSSKPISLVDPMGLYGTGVGLPLPDYGERTPYTPGPAPWSHSDFIDHYYHGGAGPIDLADIGLLDMFINSNSVSEKTGYFEYDVLTAIIKHSGGSPCTGNSGSTTVFDSFSFSDNDSVTDVTLDGPLFSVGRSTFYRSASCVIAKECCGGDYRCFTAACELSYSIEDWFKDPLDLGFELPGGTPFPITASWNEYYSFDTCD